MSASPPNPPPPSSTTRSFAGSTLTATCLPDGQDYHVAFIIDGKLRVSEIWDSQEQFEAHGQDLMPVLEQVGIDPGQPEIHEVHNVFKR